MIQTEQLIIGSKLVLSTQVYKITAPALKENNATDQHHIQGREQ